LKIEDPLKCETIRGDKIVMWGSEIGTEVKRSFGAAGWEKARNVATKAHGFEGVGEKNGMVIAVTLEELYKSEKQSSTLIKLCGWISQYAQKVRGRGRI
jgi:hypothetical protein